jgi:copper chaperone CopZ
LWHESKTCWNFVGDSGGNLLSGAKLLITLGLGAAAAVVGRYHWFFVTAAIGVLAWAWIKYFREKTRCACDQRTMNGHAVSLLTLLIASAVVLGFAALNAGSYIFAGSPPAATTAPANMQRVVIPVEGMNCVTCEIAVRKALKRMDGVESAHVSVATKSATVDYDPATTNTEQLVTAINSTGYRASLPNKVNDSASMAKNTNTTDTKTEVTRASVGENAASSKADQISMFEVSLQCPAAPQIGCGSASKPILLDLERQPGVREAWLNRAGTTIAVVWKPEPDAETRRNVTAELKEDHATEVEGESRDEALTDFLSGKGWYRGADVDRLSEEEARIIAARLVRRVQAKTALTKEKAEGLKRALTDTIRKQLTGNCSAPGQKQPSIEDVGRKYLNQEQVKILKEACEKGVRPLPNEK